jgi:hypothetical protein
MPYALETFTDVLQLGSTERDIYSGYSKGGWTIDSGGGPIVVGHNQLTSYEQKEVKKRLKYVNKELKPICE